VVLLLEAEPEGVKVKVGKRLAWASLESLLALEDLGAEGLGEASWELPEVPLEVLDNRGREGEIVSLLEERVLVELVLDHELGEVADDLGAGCNLGRVTEEQIGLGVGLLDLRPLVSEPEAEGLEVQVGVLPAWNLVGVHVGGAALHRCGALEGGVEPASLLPVVAELGHTLEAYARVQFGALKGGHDGTHGRLGGHA